MPTTSTLTSQCIPRRTAIELKLISMLGLACGVTTQTVAQGNDQNARQRFQYCLNTSTINGGTIPVRQQLKIASSAGYDSIELWVRDLDKYQNEGGSLSDLAKELSDLGLTLDSAIAFGKWIVEDPAERQAGLEQCRKDMETVAALGGKRIAAPPSGATNLLKLDLDQVAQRYRDLLEVGSKVGVVAQLELWGFSQNLSTLAEVLYVVAAAQHPTACLLLDVYHLYKGGFDFQNIGLIPSSQMPCLHINDYPQTPARSEISDKDRVYPGDGVAPLKQILSGLVRGGFTGTLSLELFNRTYWEQPADLVARTGLEKMKSAVADSLGG